MLRAILLVFLVPPQGGPGDALEELFDGAFDDEGRLVVQCEGAAVSLAGFCTLVFTIE